MLFKIDDAIAQYFELAINLVKSFIRNYHLSCESWEQTLTQKHKIVAEIWLLWWNSIFGSFDFCQNLVETCTTPINKINLPTFLRILKLPRKYVFELVKSIWLHLWPKCTSQFRILHHPRSRWLSHSISSFSHIYQIIFRTMPSKHSILNETQKKIEY